LGRPIVPIGHATVGVVGSGLAEGGRCRGYSHREQHCAQDTTRDQHGSRRELLYGAQATREDSNSKPWFFTQHLFASVARAANLELNVSRSPASAAPFCSSTPGHHRSTDPVAPSSEQMLQGGPLVVRKLFWPRTKAM